MSDLLARTQDACDQLMRYGARVATVELADALDALTDINDDLWHSRSHECVRESIDKLRSKLDEIERGLV